MAGVGGAELCAEPGLGAGLEFVLDGGRTKPSAELVRREFVEQMLNKLLGLFEAVGGGTSDPAIASAAGFGVRTAGGSDTGTVVAPVTSGEVANGGWAMGTFSTNGIARCCGC